MKTITISLSDFELIAGAAALVVQLEIAVPTTEGPARQATEEAIVTIRKALESAVNNGAVREQPKGFQQRLDEAIAAARQRQQWPNPL